MAAAIETSRLDSLESVVVGLRCSGILLIVDHEERDDESFKESQGSQIGKRIRINREKIVPFVWKGVLEDTDIVVVYNEDLEGLQDLIQKEILNYQIGSVNNNIGIFIIDGLITLISIIYSNNVSEEKIDYNKLNFRKVYILLKSINELSKYVKVQINEPLETWKIIDKIHLPYKFESDYRCLVNCLSSNNDMKSNFISLKALLRLFDICA